MADAPAYWLYEEGIGEDRALRVEHGQPVEMRIERAGEPRVGDVIAARLARILGHGRAVAIDNQKREYLADKLPREASEGLTVTVEIRREQIGERGRNKWPLVRLTDKPIARGPSLAEWIAADGLPVERMSAVGVDRLAEHGWQELMEAARTGEWQFDGGSLTISPTPAMTLIDVDGDLPSRELPFAAAPEIARVVRLFGLSGSIGIDFPTLESKSDRAALADNFDAAMNIPCERTAVNGFGFMQVVTRRERASLPERLMHGPVEDAMLDLLRRAERMRGAGILKMRCHRRVAEALHAAPDLLAMLERKLGRSVTVEEDVCARLLHAHDCVNEGEIHG